MLLNERMSFIVFRWFCFTRRAPDVLQLCPCVTFDIKQTFCFVLQLKLEGYSERLKKGDKLNQDQLVIVLHYMCCILGNGDY